MRGSVILYSLVVLAPSGFALGADSVAVTACGQTVAPKAVGYLTGDLDCTGFEGAVGAVILGERSGLELRGFKLSGGYFSVLCGGVLASDPTIIDELTNCEVIGDGGSIEGASGHGILGKRVKASGLAIRDCLEQGIESSVARVTDVTIAGNGGEGIRSHPRAVVRDSQITANGSNGVCAGSIRLVRSSVTGNGTGPECAEMGSCADLKAPHRPRLKDSFCETSLGKPYFEDGWDWDICELD